MTIREYIAAETPIKAVKFITANIIPPPKKDVLAFLGIPLQTGEAPETVSGYVRKAEVDVSETLYSCVIICFNEVYRHLKIVHRCCHRVRVRLFIALVYH